MLFISFDRSISDKKPASRKCGISLSPDTVKRIVIRSLIVAASFLVGAYFLGAEEELMDVFVGVSNTVDRKYMEVECSSDYTKERAAFGGKSTACLL